MVGRVAGFTATGAGTGGLDLHPPASSKPAARIVNFRPKNFIRGDSTGRGACGQINAGIRTIDSRLAAVPKGRFPTNQPGVPDFPGHHDLIL
jgi:hypothetical protein